MASCSWRLLRAAVCVAAALAAARADALAEPKRLALVLFEKGSPDRARIDAFLSSLAEIDGRADSITIIGKRELDRRLGRAHQEAVGACGADLRCVAAIGDKVGATHVLFGRATAQPDGVSMQWLLVSVRTAGIVGKLLVKLGDTRDAAPAAARVARELLDVAAADLAAPPPRAVAASEEPAPPAVAPSRPETERRSYWTPARVVAGSAVACGLLGLGAGVYFGNRAHHSVRDVAHDPRGTALRTALPTDDRGRADADRATVLLAAGGLLVAGGAAVWVHDWPITPVVSVDGSGGMAGVTVAW